MEFKYLNGYSENVLQQVEQLIKEKKLGDYIKKKYPKAHRIDTDKQLYEYTMEIKNNFLKKSQPLSKVVYDGKIILENQALGLHSYIPRKQGKKTKVKNEIKIASKFKKMPLEFLNHIVIHELAHLKEKNHDKAFYRLCQSMEENCGHVELDLRIYLTYVDIYKEELY
ncbi:MAG: YgjP-like metallopeptidase domain-containing protein [Psychrilyobacter sp.]|uniref:YgjP-like metallopeptidase domain-containing protein n=1 Tax=Psychrilyobacter sp. TaxID=2586924 RepID=UPI003C771FAD